VKKKLFPTFWAILIEKRLQKFVLLFANCILRSVRADLMFQARIARIQPFGSVTCRSGWELVFFNDRFRGL
jgi:hypothetical protein